LLRSLGVSSFSLCHLTITLSHLSILPGWAESLAGSAALSPGDHETALRCQSSGGRCFMGEHLLRSDDIAEPHCPQMCFTFVMRMGNVTPLSCPGRTRRRREFPIGNSHCSSHILWEPYTSHILWEPYIRPIFFGTPITSHVFWEPSDPGFAIRVRGRQGRIWCMRGDGVPVRVLVSRP
jgi:hypothetical protein